MVVASEHSPFLMECVRRETKARNPSPQAFSSEILRHSHFAIMWLAVIGPFNRVQTKTTNTKGKKCGSAVSSRFFGESVAWHPKKTAAKETTI